MDTPSCLPVYPQVDENLLAPGRGTGQPPFIHPLRRRPAGWECGLHTANPGPDLRHGSGPGHLVDAHASRAREQGSDQLFDQQAQMVVTTEIVRGASGVARWVTT
ncbi:hypothetical protein GCM10023334_012260 [Nonomuraea thailandensis]